MLSVAMSVSVNDDQSPSSLLAIAVEVLAEFVDLFSQEDIAHLPKHLKNKLRNIVLSRGLKNSSSRDALIQALLHEDVTDLILCESFYNSLQTDQLQRFLEMTPNLTFLNLNSTNIFLRGAEEAKSIFWRLRQLKIIYLRYGNIDDQALSQICLLCPNLREIDLGHCNLLTDLCLDNLGNLSLISLNLNDTRITDHGLLSFAQGPVQESLKELRIDACRSVTDDGIEAILTFCKRLKIFIFHNCPNVTDRSREALENFLLENQVSMKQLTWTVY